MENALNADEGEQHDTLMPDPAETVTDRSASVTETTAAEEATEQAEAERVAAEEAVAKAESDAAAEAEGADKEAAKPKLDWKERRRIEEMNKRRAAEARAAELEAELAALKSGQQREDATQPPGLTPEQIRAQARAEIEAESRAASFRDATGRVLQAGLSNISDFDAARQEMVQNFGDVLNARTDFFEALTGLEPDDIALDQIEAHRAQVFYALARDPEQTERLLSMPPLKMAMEVTKLSNKLAKPAAPAPKPISKAPAPVSPITGAPQTTGRLDDESMPMDEWAKRYLKEMAGKGR
jgi:hypothetical protein